jgi:SAM-dependent methyltransferase
MNLLDDRVSEVPVAGPARTGIEILSFLVIGVVAALGYVALSGFAVAILPVVPRWIVSALCYAAFIVPVYLAHRRFSFQSDVPHFESFPRYLAVQVSALVLAVLFSYLAYAVVGLPTLTASLLVIALTSGVNFVVLKLWAFAGKGRSGTTVFRPKAMLNALHSAAVFNRRVRVLADHISDLIPTGGTVLDLGCGDGSIARRVMDQRPDLSFEGVDILIRPRTHIRVTQFDGGRLPFPDQSFDYVTVIDVLHHTDQPAEVLAEAVRVARRGVVLKDHLQEGLLARQTLRLMDWVGNRGHDVVLPYNYFTRAQRDAMIDRVGCVPVRTVEQLGIYPAPASWLFDRGLHFMGLLKPARA